MKSKRKKEIELCAYCGIEIGDPPPFVGVRTARGYCCEDCACEMADADEEDAV